MIEMQLGVAWLDVGSTQGLFAQRSFRSANVRLHVACVCRHGTWRRTQA